MHSHAERVVRMGRDAFDNWSPAGNAADIVVRNERTGSVTRHVRESSFRNDFVDPIVDVSSSSPFDNIFGHILGNGPNNIIVVV